MELLWGRPEGAVAGRLGGIPRKGPGGERPGLCGGAPDPHGAAGGAADGAADHGGLDREQRRFLSLDPGVRPRRGGCVSGARGPGLAGDRAHVPLGERLRGDGGFGLPGAVRVCAQRRPARGDRLRPRGLGAGDLDSGGADGRGKDRGGARGRGDLRGALPGRGPLLRPAHAGHGQRPVRPPAGVGERPIPGHGPLHPPGARRGVAQRGVCPVPCRAGDHAGGGPGGGALGAPLVPGQQTGAPGRLRRGDGGPAADGRAAAEARHAPAPGARGQGRGRGRVPRLRRVHERLPRPRAGVAGPLPRAGDPPFGHAPGPAAGGADPGLPGKARAAGRVEPEPGLSAADVDGRRPGVSEDHPAERAGTARRLPARE